ncbi:MAG: hypothetical protein RI930_201 [Pseudomonadota bacterium]|jgi:hypothetical protein
MTKEIRDSFIFYRSFFEMAEQMNDQEQLSFFRAICQLALNGQEVQLSGMPKIAFIGAKPNILANTTRYQNGKKGAEHGKKGGRPKTPRKPLENPSGVLENNPKETPNKDVNYNYNQNKDVKSEIIIPNFIDQILFDEFLQQRKKDKNPIEGMALKLTIEDLEKWENKNKGNANLAVKNAIKGGWKSLVEPKTQSLGSGYNSQNQKSDYEKWKEANGK